MGDMGLDELIVLLTKARDDGARLIRADAQPPWPVLGGARVRVCYEMEIDNEAAGKARSARRKEADA